MLPKQYNMVCDCQWELPLKSHYSRSSEGEKKSSTHHSSRFAFSSLYMKANVLVFRSAWCVQTCGCGVCIFQGPGRNVLERVDKQRLSPALTSRHWGVLGLVFGHRGPLVHTANVRSSEHPSGNHFRQLLIPGRLYRLPGDTRKRELSGNADTGHCSWLHFTK